MALRLPRLDRLIKIVTSDFTPTQIFHQWWQKVVEMIEAHETRQDEVINRIRRLMSHTTPTTILSAQDVGASVTITVLDHTRVYADATTLSIIGDAPHTGLSHDTMYACYYDDDTLSVTSPVFVFTTDLFEAQSATAEGRHFCGLIRTPLAASGQTISSGGVYPAGGNAVGGELV